MSLAVLEPPKIEIPKLACGYGTFSKGFREGVMPLPAMDVREWADKYRYLAGETASEEGKYYSSRTPMMIELMESMSPQSEAEITVAMMPTQEGKTEAGMNAVFYRLHYAPGPIAIYFPTNDDADAHSKLKVQPSIEATPVLREKMDMMPHGSITVRTKLFPSAVLRIMGAESPKNIRNISFGFVQAEEIDEWQYDVGGQGDPTELLIKRLGTYLQKGGKVYFASTPTIHGFSKIEKWFNESDQRYYHVPCPMCGDYQRLMWPQLKYDAPNHLLKGDPVYECIHCKKTFQEHHKSSIIADGVSKWIPTKPEVTKIRGYQSNKLYSPLGWTSWNTLVEEWLRATREMDVTKMKVFVNTSLAETWKKDVEVQDPDKISARREKYVAQVPAGAAVIVVGADVQGDRVELEARAWGPGFENWGIEYKIIRGSIKYKEVKEEVADFMLNTVYKHELGIDMKILGSSIDTGHLKAEVYEFLKVWKGSRIFGVKGSSVPDYPAIGGGKKDKASGIKLWMVGPNTCKERVFGYLDIDEPGPGYCHFPDDYGDEYFEQLTNEIAVIRKGKRVFEPRRPGVAVEALDCFVYGRAVLDILGTNLDSEYKRLLRKVERVNNPPAAKQKAEIRSRNKTGKKKSFAMRGM